MNAVNKEATEKEGIRFPEAPAALRGSRVGLLTAFQFFGPGAIVASVTVGSGETIFASRLGAAFGYSIMWAVIVGVIAKAALVYGSNRYLIFTGEHPMTRFAKLFPGPRGWFPIVIGITAIACFPSFISGFAVALGGYLSQFGAGNAQVLTIVLLLVGAALAFFGTYSFLEKAQLVIVGTKLVLVIVAVFVARPEWLSVLAGFVPTLPAYEPFVAQRYPEIAARPVFVEVVTFIGAIGGGMYDYIGYTSLMRDKGWGLLAHRDIDAIGDRVAALGPRERVPLAEDPENVARARAWSRAPLSDVVVSFILITIFGLAFMINGANILNDRQQIPAEDNVLTYQAQFLEVVSPVLQYLYIVAIILIFFAPLYGLWELYVRTTYESFAAVSERVRRAGVLGVRRWVYLYILVTTLILATSGADIVTLVTPANIIGGTLAGGIYCVGLIYADRKVLPPEYRLGLVPRALLVFAAVFLTFFGLLGLAQFVGLA